MWQQSRHADGSRPRARAFSEAMKEQTATSGDAYHLESQLSRCCTRWRKMPLACARRTVIRLRTTFFGWSPYGEIPVNIQARGGIPANRERVIDERPASVDDSSPHRGGESEFPAGSSDANGRATGQRLRRRCCARASIGVIYWRWKPTVFRQADGLLEKFADQLDRHRKRACLKRRSNAHWRSRRPIAIGRTRSEIDASGCWPVGIFI